MDGEGLPREAAQLPASTVEAGVGCEPRLPETGQNAEIRMTATGAEHCCRAFGEAMDDGAGLGQQLA